MALIVAAIAAPASRGQIVLFDNTAFTGGGNTIIASSTPVGDSFSTGAASVTLTSFSAGLLRTASASGSTTFWLYSDNATSPGTSIANLGTINDTSLTGSVADYSLTGLSVPLSASTRYWIMATATGVARWNSEPGDSGTGVAGEFLTVRGAGVLDDSNGPFNMEVVATSDGLSAVPEPSTYALWAGGAALLVAVVRRRGKLQAS